jgi:hypothetical protein
MSVLDAIAKQYEDNKAGNSSNTSYEQDFSKYFAVRLEDGENNGEQTIRLMPPKEGVHPLIKEGDTPFDEGHWHSVKVGGKWRKIYCRKHNDGEVCPLCDVSAELWQEWKDTGDKGSKELSNSYKARKYYIARLINRDKESDGVKFWRFPHNFKGEGALDKIIPLFTKKGDITNPREGRDLTIMLGRDNKNYTKITSIMTEDPGVLTDPSAPQAKEWMGDDTSWKDVYSAQPLDYIQLIADGEIPQWDKNLERFVAKGDDSEGESSYKKSTTTTTTESSTPVEKTETTNTPPTIDDSKDEEMPF